MIFSLPLIMVIIFLIFTLIVGLYYSKKTTTLKEYAIGHKNFTTATLVATVLATVYGGGGLVRTVQQVYEQGLYWIIFMLIAMTCSVWILSPLVIRMGPFMENFSMAETIGQVYGRVPRIMTALSGIGNTIAGLAIQINIIEQAIGICMHNINPKILSIIATLILTAYSAFGGIRVVTITDVLQCITFVLIIPCLAWIMFHNMHTSFKDIVITLSSYEKFQFSHVFQWHRPSIRILFLTLTCLMGCMSPDIIQRVYLSSNVLQARKVFLLSSILTLPITTFILLIGIFVFVENPTLPLSTVWSYITMGLLPLFKGFLAISLLALAMSTADSCLNACSIMISHDIIAVVRTKKISPLHQLRLARMAAFLVGGLAMWLAFHNKDLLDLLQLSCATFLPITTAPMLLAIFGFCSSARTALIGMATGIITILVWQKYLPDIDGSFPAMLANGIAMLLAHYSLPKGKGDSWEKPSLEYQQLQQARQRRFYRFKKYMKNLFSDLLNMPINTYQMVFLLFMLL